MYNMRMELKVIARIKTDYAFKFGVPRQSGLAKTVAYIVFEKEYRAEGALRGIEGFDYLWLIWGFHKLEKSEDTWSPTVRPPRLGGNKRVGVFATRSPYRPNRIGLSCVKLLGVERTKENGETLIVEGADMVDGTPIYDVKPYLTYCESHPEARQGFVDETPRSEPEITFASGVKEQIASEKLSALIETLRADPRPAYKKDGDRVYGFVFDNKNVRFTVTDGVLTVLSVSEIDNE